ncbi:MAG: HalX domain-containing protein [Halopenitus sp.]
MSEEPPLILVVEDEPDLADLYAAWLGDDYRVRTAYGGREALDALDDEIDAILLDRRMPGLSGDEVLDQVRDRGIDCRVAMVTAVEPDFDIIEMGFDDYLVKPVSKESLRETVESLLERNEYEEGVQDLFSVSSKIAVLEAEKRQAELEENEEYQRLKERHEELQDEMDTTVSGFTEHEEFEGLFREVGDEEAEDIELPDGDEKEFGE